MHFDFDKWFYGQIWFHIKRSIATFLSDNYCKPCKMKNKISSLSTFHQSKCSVFKQCFYEYLRCSQIHGYKFIMAKDRPFFERTYWATIALTIISLTMGLIISGYLHFVRGPTVTSEFVNGFPVLNMPFPAVGLCSSNRISRSALMEFSSFMYLLIFG